MSNEPTSLLVIYAPIALAELDAIWDWNSRRYGSAHAASYMAFLRDEIDRLRDAPQLGRPVGARPGLRYLVIRRRPGGYGHIAVYKCNSGEINVLHVFHTSQEWQSQIS